MIGWVSLLTSVFSFAKELFKYMREKEAKNKQCALKIEDAKNAISHARKTKDTSKLESAFNNLRLSK